MFSPRRFKAIAKKEFLELKRNKLFFMMTILAPLILYFLFAYGFPLDAKNITLGVVDLDKTALSRNLIGTFETAGGIFHIGKISGSFKDIEKELKRGKIRAALIIPMNFAMNIRKGRPVTLQVLVDASYPNTANLIGGYVEAVVGSFHSDVLQDFLIKQFGYGGGGAGVMPIDLSVSAWYNSSFRSEDFIIPGVIAIIMMFFPPLVATVSLAKEKESGSILNMYCSSITRAEYLLGKMLPYVIISYINILIFIVLSVYLFDVPMRGSLLVLLVFSVFYVAGAISLGLLVAVLVSTQVAAILITCIGTLVPAFMYSGFMVPISNIGDSAKSVAYMMPCTYYIDLVRKVMVKGASFLNVGMDAAALTVFCLFMYFICIKLFKKRLG